MPPSSEPNLTTRKRVVRSAANPWSTSRANGWSTSPIRGGQLPCKRVVKSARNRAALRGVDAKYIARTMLEPGDLDQAERALLNFQAAWGRREVINPGRDDLNILRARSFTYLYDAYELARRVVIFFEGEEEADRLVPSLFVNPAKGKRGENEGDNSEAAGDAPATPAAPAAAKLDASKFEIRNTDGFPEDHPFETKGN